MKVENFKNPAIFWQPGGTYLSKYCNFTKKIKKIQQQEHNPSKSRTLEHFFHKSPCIISSQKNLFGSNDTLQTRRGSRVQQASQLSLVTTLVVKLASSFNTSGEAHKFVLLTKMETWFANCNNMYVHTTKTLMAFPHFTSVVPLSFLM
jgi:hypothetical protein